MIVITGASSFIGKNLLERIDKKVKVLCLVRKRIPNFNFKQEVVDFSKKSSFSRFINNGDTIIHLAGITDGTRNELISVNYELTKNIIDVAKENGIKRFIFLSTAIVEMKNKGFYGESKLHAEEYIKNSQIRYIILRPSIVYGRGEKKFISRIVEMIKKYRLVPVIGDGNYVIGTVYIEDLIKAIIKSIKLKKDNKTYFVSSRDNTSMNEIYKTISGLLNRKVYLLHVPLYFLKLASILIRNFKKDFPSSEQFGRITMHEKCNTQDTERDFKIKFQGFKEGIRKVLT